MRMYPPPWLAPVRAACFKMKQQSSIKYLDVLAAIDNDTITVPVDMSRERFAAMVLYITRFGDVPQFERD
jgi:hypothetical protein